VPAPVNHDRRTAGLVHDQFKLTIDQVGAVRAVQAARDISARP
jgi:hypothetical protein